MACRLGATSLRQLLPCGALAAQHVAQLVAVHGIGVRAPPAVSNISFIIMKNDIYDYMTIAVNYSLILATTISQYV